MARNLFSVPIFFIVFRETLEAAIIISVLLGLVEQIVRGNNDGKIFAHHRQRLEQGNADEKDKEQPSDSVILQRLIRKLRIQIFLGAGVGLFIALAIGAAFIAIWFTKASDLWMKSEELWEGIFELIASILIFVMGITMLKMDRAKIKWRIKLERAFLKQTESTPDSSSEGSADRQANTGKWVLFILPLITVLREGLEAVIFVGGVSLGQPAASIPIATIVGLICGFVCGFFIYAFASRTTLTTFLIIMTNFILLIGAGLFSKAIGALQEHAFNNLLGGDVDDASAAGNGPGSYDVRGNVWHLDCCNPESKTASQGWLIFGAVFGWTNNATLGTVLGYVFYWIAVIVALVYLKFREGRTKLLGYESEVGKRRRERNDNTTAGIREKGDDADYELPVVDAERNVINRVHVQ